MSNNTIIMWDGWRKRVNNYRVHEWHERFNNRFIHSRFYKFREDTINDKWVGWRKTKYYILFPDVRDRKRFKLQDHLG